MHGSQAFMVNNHPPSRGGPRTRVVVVKHIILLLPVIITKLIGFSE